MSGEKDWWPSFGLHNSGEGRWSEEDLRSCVNSAEELVAGPGVWDQCTTEETESSTPGHSSHNSSEHLSLLFRHHYSCPSSSSSVADWIPQRLQTGEENPECRCSANCAYSRSSAYHWMVSNMDPCPNEPNSDSSRSLNCSLMLLTDCNDGYHKPPCDDYPSSGGTLDLESTDSMDREWTDGSISRDEAGDSLSQESSLMDLDVCKNSRLGHDVTCSQAALSFKSTLKGALKKLEGSNPEDCIDDGESEELPSSVRQASAQEVQNPEEDREALVFMETPENLTYSLQTSPHETAQSACTSTGNHSRELPQGKGVNSTEVEISKNNETPEREVGGPMSPGTRPDEVVLSPIKENQILDEVYQGRHTSANHRERIANFQRILREKRQARHQLSRSAPGSQSSHGSQGSQGSQSQDEFIEGT